MMPGRRTSDDFLGFLAGVVTILLLFVMAWGGVLFIAAGSWAFFQHCLRLWGAA